MKLDTVFISFAYCRYCSCWHIYAICINFLEKVISTSYRQNLGGATLLQNQLQILGLGCT